MWAATKNLKSSLARTQNKMSRIIPKVKLKDHIKIKDLKKRAKVKEVIECVRFLKWNWAGHMIRMEDRWTKITTEWTPNLMKQKKGRPKKRWRDEIDEAAGNE
ncbi:hypothetical protein ILUMI_07643 [Ignelater luminosus]|uniref:Endonuclease-reverse transcriptase n=1 Tax=Ignelater luminosus TaxID=2038154 RepID=A0A8K0D8E9_IGNLU|nr:hypothetical protein ILUMI_07643 [Ignelater luminosus]